MGEVNQLLKATQLLLAEKQFVKAFKMARKAQAIPEHSRDCEILDVLHTCAYKGGFKRLGVSQAWCERVIKMETLASSLAVTPDGGCIVTGTVDGTLQLWELAAGDKVQQYIGHKSSIGSLVISPDGRFLLSKSFKKAIGLWEVGSGKKLKWFEGAGYGSGSLVFSANSKYALPGIIKGTFCLWDLSNLKIAKQFEVQTDSALSVALTPDDRHALISGVTDQSMRLYEIDSGLEVRRFDEEWIASVAIVPDGSLALSGSWDKSVKLWDLQTGTEIQRYMGHGDRVHRVLFSPGGRHFVSRSYDRTAILYQTGSGRVIRRFQEPEHRLIQGLNTVVFSPDSEYLLSTEGGNIPVLYETATGNEISKLEGHKDTVMNLAFTPNGRYAISSSNDKTIRIWQFDWEWEMPDSTG